MSEEESRIVTIRADGKTALKVTVTVPAKKLGLYAGDQVRITLSRIDRVRVPEKAVIKCEHD